MRPLASLSVDFICLASVRVRSRSFFTHLRLRFFLSKRLLLTIPTPQRRLQSGMQSHRDPNSVSGIAFLEVVCWLFVVAGFVFGCLLLFCCCFLCVCRCVRFCFVACLWRLCVVLLSGLYFRFHWPWPAVDVLLRFVATITAISVPPDSKLQVPSVRQMQSGLGHLSQ